MKFKEDILTELKNCPITDSSIKIKYFNLGNIPLVNNLCNSREDSMLSETYPLDINYYPESKISTLGCAVNGEMLFSNYLYKSGVNIPYYDHCKNMFKYAMDYVKKSTQKIKVLDIGGNDGTLLDCFRDVSEYELELLNIDPSINLSEMCVKKNIPVLTDFFSFKLASTLSDKFDIITSTNVFQHLKDIQSFADGVEFLLSDSGIWILEFPYWIDSLKTNQFDQIYHEHVYYYSIYPLNILMDKCKLKIVNISHQNIHGGSLRLVITKKSSELNPDSSIQSYLDAESEYTQEYYTQWGDTIKTHIEKSKKFIESLKSDGNKIYGFGAAAKGCIYLNAMGLNYNDIDFVIDDTNIKQNKFIPGTGIQVVSRDILKTNPPNYILILAHNFSEYIIKSLENEYNGKFITLIPSIKVIE